MHLLWEKWLKWGSTDHLNFQHKNTVGGDRNWAWQPIFLLSNIANAVCQAWDVFPDVLFPRAHPHDNLSERTVFNTHHLVVFWVSHRWREKSSHISSKYQPVTKGIWANMGTTGGNGMCIHGGCDRPTCSKTFSYGIETGDRTTRSTDAPLDTTGEVNGFLEQLEIPS